VNSTQQHYRESKGIQILSNQVSRTPAGLYRTKRIIKAELDKEILFMLLCSQINLNDYKAARSEKQRNQRIAKRK
jgi:hypothetical protein